MYISGIFGVKLIKYHVSDVYFNKYTSIKSSKLVYNTSLYVNSIKYSYKIKFELNWLNIILLGVNSLEYSYKIY